MQSIIDGRMYNTDTATLVANHDNMADVRNFHYANEALYIKKTGEWFLLCEGQGLSKYGVQRGNEFCWGERIIPYNEEDAKMWLEENNKVDAYIKYFGEPEE